MRGEGTRAIIPGMTGDPHLAECPAPGHGPPIRASRLSHAMAARSAGVARGGNSATKQPSGRYASTFATMSKRVARIDQGVNAQKGVPGSGAIHSPNGCRLA